MSVSILVIFLMSALCAIMLRLWSKIRIGDALTAAIMFLPALLYWVDSMPLEEISGGKDGVTLKLRAVSASPLSDLSLDLEAVAVRHDPDAQTDNMTAAFWEKCGDYITMRSSDVPDDAAERDKYVVNLATAIRASLRCGRLIGVVVVDERERYIGSFDATFFAELTALWTMADADRRPSASDLASMFSQHTVFGAALRFPETRLESGEGFDAAINREAPLAFALQRFAETNATFLALTDERGVLTGILPRKRVLDAILVALVGSESAEATKGN